MARPHVRSRVQRSPGRKHTVGSGGGSTDERQTEIDCRRRRARADRDGRTGEWRLDCARNRRFGGRGPRGHDSGADLDGRNRNVGGLPRDGDARSDQGLRLPRQRRRGAGLRRARTRQPRHDAQQRHRDADHAEPARDRFHAALGCDLLGWASGDGRGRGVQPQARRRPEGRRLLLQRLRPREVDHRRRPAEGSDQAVQAGLLAPGRAVFAGRHDRREGVRAEARREVRHRDRRHDVLRPVHGVLVEDRPGRDLRPEPALLGHAAHEAEAEEDQADRRAR